MQKKDDWETFILLIEDMQVQKAMLCPILCNVLWLIKIV